MSQNEINTIRARREREIEESCERESQAIRQANVYRPRRQRVYEDRN